VWEASLPNRWIAVGQLVGERQSATKVKNKRPVGLPGRRYLLMENPGRPVVNWQK